MRSSPIRRIAAGSAGIPIVGPTGQQNNNYVNDLRNDLAAAIDELDRARRSSIGTRLAIGGHSYGAFSTVNAMVNTPFFKAGIAGDGAYNRTLTPFGFQNERRTLWEAPNVYFDMSPFLRANHLTGALLMYHGMARPERRHRPDQLRAPLPGAERARQDDGALPVSARRSRPGGARDAARPVGALGARGSTSTSRTRSRPSSNRARTEDDSAFAHRR